MSFTASTLTAVASTAVIASAEHPEGFAIPFPPVVFALIAAVVFAALGFVVWSFRDAANRHSRGAAGSADHSPEHH
ncbi:hypothetical protein [Marisediminicola sp. LYQ134]|uniref:hypothetical protein n=1 Tax=unclassified Marisediminicola TaxID=2618316 RepID=UPI0039833D11